MSHSSSPAASPGASAPDAIAVARSLEVVERPAFGDPGPDEVPDEADPDVQEDLGQDDGEGGNADRPVVDVERE